MALDLSLKLLLTQKPVAVLECSQFEYDIIGFPGNEKNPPYTVKLKTSYIAYVTVTPILLMKRVINSAGMAMPERLSTCPPPEREKLR
jgi:hypothetical protein